MDLGKTEFTLEEVKACAHVMDFKRHSGLQFMRVDQEREFNLHRSDCYGHRLLAYIRDEAYFRIRCVILPCEGVLPAILEPKVE